MELVDSPTQYTAAEVTGESEEILTINEYISLESNEQNQSVSSNEALTNNSELKLGEHEEQVISHQSIPQGEPIINLPSENYAPVTTGEKVPGTAEPVNDLRSESMIAGDQSPENETAQEDDDQQPCEEPRDSMQFDDSDHVAVTVSEQQLELIQLVRGEIEANNAALSELLGTVNSQDVDIENRLTELRRYSDIIARFSVAAESVGLNGLHQVLNQLQYNIQHYIENFELFSLETNNLLSQWPVLVIQYLDNYQDKKTGPEGPVSSYVE